MKTYALGTKDILKWSSSECVETANKRKLPNLKL